MHELAIHVLIEVITDRDSFPDNPTNYKQSKISKNFIHGTWRRPSKTWIGLNKVGRLNGELLVSPVLGVEGWVVWLVGKIEGNWVELLGLMIDEVLEVFGLEKAGRLS